VNTNWGKRSIALDFKDADDVATLRALIATADVLVENFRPAVMPGIGLVAEELVAEHPRLVYAALRGFPSDSSMADAPAYDHVMQAITGFGASQADLRTGEPVLVQQAVVDKVTGLTAAQAITAALFERHRTGRGQVIEVPMLYAGLSFVWPDVSTNVSLQGDFDRLPPQSRSFRLTRTADGYVAMTTVTTPQWNGLLRAVGLDELVGHSDYDSPQQRGRNGGRLMKKIGAQLAQFTTAEVTAKLTEQGVPHAAVSDIDDLPAVIEQISPGYLVREVHPEVGEVLHPRPAVTFGEPVTVQPAPALGEHTDEIKAELRN
jgi:crotonobetainyl-CoA:carnitine CoA-transferase CaiB-like acyl-CoA transferase